MELKIEKERGAVEKIKRILRKRQRALNVQKP